MKKQKSTDYLDDAYESERPVTAYDQDNDWEYEMRVKKQRSNILYNIAMVLFAGIFLACVGILGQRLLQDRQTENEFAELEALIDTSVTPAPDTTVVEQDEPAVEENAARFAALRERNEDFIGWISIEGTNLNFPVMCSPDEPDFYLRHDFNGQYSDYGVPYLESYCTLNEEEQSDNLVIYGHNMKTGTIFGCLTGYKEASYYEKHPVIEFDNLYNDGDYEVFAAFAIDVIKDQSFRYNTYLDMDEATFDSFVDEVIRRSDVDSGIRPVYGDHLLTLSTCEYSTSNGRYVVCAVRRNES